ncbi:MAG: YggT family protein [Thermomicrobiales bacterium]
MSNDFIGIITLLINILSIAIIGRALLSWFDPGMRSPVGKILHDITEPIIAPIRQVVPRLGMIDISPIVALLLLNLLSRVLVQAF